MIVLESSLGNLAILSSVGARLLLNMKEAGLKGLNEGLGSSALQATVSGMNFAVPLAQTQVDPGAGGEEERSDSGDTEMVDL